MEQFTSLEGPVERSGETLVLKIPLAAGGDTFIDCTRGIGVVHDDMLLIEIKDWLATKLELSEGDLVSVDNAGGKFNIRKSIS